MTISRKTLLLMTLILLSASIASAQNVSVSYKEEKLKTILVDIHDKTGFNFVYNNSLINDEAVVTVSANGELSSVLKTVLSGLPIDFEIIDKQIILHPKTVAADNKKITVNGTVLDDSGLPLPGVFVSEKGTKNGTATDMNGKYTIIVSSSSFLEYSSLGFTNREIAVPKGGGTLDITLGTDSIALDEVVVVGYGVQKKVNLTGSVSAINFSEGLDSRPITSTSTALGGLAPGLVVTQTSGRPGEDGASLRIRGNTTLNTNSPLVLVDGIEYSMDNINPQDIETISILKDASSTAIYGSRAANGVILITTKSGKSGKMHVSYSGNFTLQMPHIGGLGFVTDYAESMRLVNEGADNVGVTHPYSNQTIALWENAKQNPDALNAYGVKNSIAYPNTDWFKELFQNGFLRSHNVSLSGGTDKLKSYISLGYMNNPGVISHHGLDSGTRKFDIRANVEMNIAKWLTGGIRVFGERQDYGLSDISSGFGYLKMAIPGIYPGSQNKWGDIASDEENPNANNPFRNMASVDGESFNYRFSATAFLKAELYKGLFFEVTGNHNVNLGYEHKYTASANEWDYVTNTLRSTTSLTTATNTISISNSYRTNGEAILRYNNTFGKHDVGAFAGFSMNYHIAPWSNCVKQGKSDWAITEQSAYTNLLDSNSGNSEWSLMSWFGRINYSYASKYLLEANLRADGSSRFAPKSRWGIFPSFSAGWRINEESFMSSTKSWLENLKLRASWGVTGNNNSGNYAWQSTFSSVGVVSGGVDSQGLITTALGNNLLVWETTRTGDIGLDFGLFKNKLTGEMDGYIKNTSGILYRPSIYITMGAVNSPYQNLAGVRNTGFEFALKWRDSITKDLSYSASLNFAYNKTVVTKYKGKLCQEWKKNEDDPDSKGTYYNNIGDVAQSAFGGYIVEDHILGDQYILKLYKGTGAGYSGTGDVDINAGPVDGMIRTEADLNWVMAMMMAGYKFQGYQALGKNILTYGDFIYADLNGDGNYGNNDDYYFTGHSNTPKITTGLTLGLKWKGFDFYTLLSGAFGFYLNWNTSIYNTSLVNTGQSISRRIANDHYYYNPTGDPALNNITGTYPRLTYNKTTNTDLSDFYHYKGDYVKIKSIQIGYTFPKVWMDKIKVESLRIFVTGENLFTFTKYPGLDPEIGTSVGYPLLRSICGGIQITL